MCVRAGASPPSRLANVTSWPDPLKTRRDVGPHMHSQVRKAGSPPLLATVSRATIPFPEHTIFKTLDRLIRLRDLKSFRREQAVLLIRFDSDKIAPEFLRHNGSSPTPGERIENEIPRIRAREDYLREKLFGFLRRVIRVLGHRPERDRDVGPDV